MRFKECRNGIEVEHIATGHRGQIVDTNNIVETIDIRFYDEDTITYRLRPSEYRPTPSSRRGSSPLPKL